MEHSEIIVGLDIGTTKIACIVGRKNEHGKLEILGYGTSDSIGVSRGMVSNIEKTVISIKEAVEVAQRNSNVEIKVVNVGIAGQHIKSLQHSGLLTRDDIDSEISQKDIDALISDMYKLVLMPGEEILHVLPQLYTVDGEQGIKDPVGMSGIRLECDFHIITGQTNAARNILKCVTRAGLTIDQLILEPLASSEAVLSQEEKEAGVALVDIGGGTTDIAIFEDGIIRHSAVIPFGGNVITDDIKKGCNIMQHQAETLKRKFGSALAMETKENEVVCIPGLRGRDPKEISVKTLAQIIEARMTEIIESVYYEIQSSGYEKKLIGGIVITGGGSQLRSIMQLFQYHTGMDCRIGYSHEHVAKTPSDALTSPVFATGVGLVLKGYERMGRPIIKTEAPKPERPQPETENPRIKEQRTSRSKWEKFGMSRFMENIREFFDEESDD